MNRGAKELAKLLPNHGDQHRLAVKLGITDDKLSRIKNARLLPTSVQRAKLQDELGIDWRLWDEEAEETQGSNGGAAA